MSHTHKVRVRHHDLDGRTMVNKRCSCGDRVLVDIDAVYDDEVRS